MAARSLLPNINPWHYLWIFVLLAEVLALICNAAISFLRWGRIDGDLLIVGSIDALVVALAAALIAVRFLRQRVRSANADDRRQAAIQAREQTQDYFQSIFDKFPDPLMVINRDHSIAFANQAVRRLAGQDPVANALTCHQASHHSPTPCRSDAHPCPLGHVWRFKEATTVEHEHYDAGGQPRWIEIVAAPLLDDAGEVAQVIEYCRDVTSQREAEARLRESEERYRHILAVAPDVITITQLADGRYLEVNDYFCRVMGYAREEVIDRTSLELNMFVNPDDRRRLVEAVMASGEVNDMEIPYRRKDGTRIDTRLAARRIQLEGKDCLVAVKVDITAHKRAALALQESEEKYRLLVEHQSDLVVKVDPEGRFLFASPSYCKTFGKREDELLGKTFMPLVHPEDREPTARAMENLYRPPYQAYVEQRAQTKDGWRWLAWADTAVLDDQGQIAAIIGVGRDITARVEADRQRSELVTRLHLAQRMEAIGTLAGGIAHDFNNILSAVIGYTEIALQDAAADGAVSESLRNVLLAGERARELVKQILAFSRQGISERKPIRPRSMLREALKLLRATLPTTIAIVEEAHSEATVMADPTQLHQVIMNLCTNAAQAMREQGGTLTVGLVETELDDAFVRTHPSLTPGTYLKLSVSDTGCGIAADLRERIFYPFFTTKPQGEGTGLGLAVVDGVVREHGGVITVASQLGQGTRFDVYLPVVDARDESMRQVEHALERGDERILVVDDEPFQVDLVARLLSSLGYAVTTAAASREALERFRNAPADFDLVITDMTMPELTGDRLAREILAIRPNMPLILCTGYSEAIDETKAKRLGIREFVMKPVVFKDLACIVRRALDGKAR